MRFILSVLSIFVNPVQRLCVRLPRITSNQFRKTRALKPHSITSTRIATPSCASGSPSLRSTRLQNRNRNARSTSRACFVNTSWTFVTTRPAISSPRAKEPAGGPVTVFDAHMDTVFQPGLKIKATVRDGRVYAPGIGDDTRNIEALLATIRALDAAKIKTKGDLVFLFTTDEEAGMTGAKQYTKDNKGKVDYYIALDGGYEGFTYAGIGINWYRHHFIGPGGHTRSRTPPYSATLPLARAIARIYELKVPTSPSSNLNIGMLGGSEVVNAKASDAWFTVDLRSTSNEVIADLEKKIAAILR